MLTKTNTQKQQKKINSLLKTKEGVKWLTSSNGERNEIQRRNKRENRIIS